MGGSLSNVVIGHGAGLSGPSGLPVAGLPVAGPLRALFPGAGLRRGSVVAVAPGAAATALLLALLATPLAAGSWAGIVGMRALGLEAAAALGVCLDRLALVPDPGTDWATVTAALLDALDLVVVVPPRRPRSNEVRRLTERARQRAAVLVVAGLEHSGNDLAWSVRPDVELATEVVGWEGLGTGYGTLRRRQVAVSSAGRRGADRRLEARVWLPGPEGQLVGNATAALTGGEETQLRARRVARRAPAGMARAG